MLEETPIKEYIIERCKNYSTLPEDARDDFIGLIDLTCGQSFKPESLFNELLQNCNDAGSAIDKPVNVSFSLVGDYLVMQHDGKHFDLDDVKGICSCAKSSQLKRDDERSIGHKGIGFKSVFLLSDDVYIYSKQGCSFRFDKAFFNQDQTPAPWQLIPIWTTPQDLDPKIQELLNKDKVNFFIKLKPEYLETIKKSAEALLKDGRELLFLDQVKSLTVNIDGQAQSMQLKKGKTTEHNQVDITHLSCMADGESRSEWIVFDCDYDLREDISTMLQTADNVPKKFKTADSMKISLAFRHNEKVLLNPQGKTVFCHLSTGIAAEFPYLVNGSFFLNLGRTELNHDNISQKWNTFLLSCVYQMQLDALSYIAQETVFWRDVIDFVCTPENLKAFGLQGKFKSINGWFQSAVAETKFLKNISTDGLLAVKGSYHDIYRFIFQFGNNELRHQSIHPDIRNIQRLATITDKDNLFTRFQSNEIILHIQTNPSISSKINTPESNTNLIVLLYKMYKNLKQEFKPKTRNKLKTLAFVLSSKSKLLTAEQVLLHGESARYLDQLDFLVFVTPELAAHKEYESIKLWLAELGARYPRLKSACEQAGDNEDHHLKIIDALLQGMQDGNITDATKIEGKEAIKLRTSKGKLLFAKECYLRDELTPGHCIQKHLPDFAGFTSNKYKNHNMLRKLFVGIGVQQSIRLDNVENFASAVKTMEAVLYLTRLIFTELYLKNTGDRIKLEKLRKKVQDLPVIDTTDQLRKAGEIYLADCYQPENKLQAVIPELSYVSSRYAESELTEWGQFFEFIGVLSSITCSNERNSSRQKINSLPLGSEYLNYLGIKYPNLYSTYTQPFQSFYTVHYVTNYFVIQDVDKLITSDYFWSVIKENWEEISEIQKQNCRYYADSSQSTIETNISYYVKLIVKKQLGYENILDVDLTDIYTATSIQAFQVLDYQLPTLAVPEEIDGEMLEALGFRTQLKKEDAFAILALLAEREDNKKTRQMLLKVYYDLIDCDYMQDDENKSIKLLSSDHSYQPSSGLHGLLCENFELVSASSNILYRLPELENQDYKKLCETFDLNIIYDDMLEISPVEQQADTALIDSFFEKLAFIILLESKQDNKVTSEEIRDFATKKAAELYKKITSLQFYQTDGIHISYQDVFSQEEDYWISQDEKSVYYTGLESYIIKPLCDFLSEKFSLSISADKLFRILETTNTRLAKHFKARGFGSTTIEMAQEIVDKQIKAHKKTKSRKRKRLESDVSSEETAEKRRRMSSVPKEIKDEIGRKAEQFVYKHYQDKYSKKYPEDFKETKNGFVIKAEGYSRKLTWFDKNEKGFGDHDMVMEIMKEKNGAVTKKTRIIEVKGTSQKESKITAYFSQNEHRKMTDTASAENQRYDLWLVSNALREGQQRYKKIKDFSPNEEALTVTYSKKFPL